MLIGCGLLAAALTWFVAGAIWGVEARPDAGWGLVVACGGALAGAIPLFLMRQRALETAGLWALAAMGVRMLTTLGAALAVLMIGRVQAVPFACGLCIGYLLFLAVEVFASVKGLGQNSGAGGGEAASPPVPEAAPPHPLREESPPDELLDSGRWG